MNQTTWRVLAATLYGSLILLGWAFPLLGTATIALLLGAVLLGQRRIWCSSLCPRGSFLDLVAAKLSPSRPIPRFLLNRRVWLAGFALFLSAFLGQLLWTLRTAGPDPAALGLIAWRMCLVSSLVALPLALWRHQRAWCAVCPMGRILRR